MIQNKPASTADPISDAWMRHNVPAISLRLAREEFEASPPAVQTERRERAVELARKHPRSYLARHLKEIYG